MSAWANSTIRQVRRKRGKSVVVDIEDVQEAFCGKYRNNMVPLCDANPSIAAEWAYEKNCGWGPEDFSHGSGVNAWWQCPACHRQYKAQITKRTAGGHGCPYCASRRVCSDNALSVLFPEIAADWHPQKNGSMRPENVLAKSPKKYWWQCKSDPLHIWQSKVQDRTLKETGCPYCSHKYASDENRLSVLYPEVAAEWHPTKNRFLYSKVEGWEGHKNRQFPRNKLPEKNRRLQPSDLSYASNEEITWQCKKNPEHVWEAKVLSRTIGERGCPFCSGNKVSADNNLQAVHPQIAKQWHASRNHPLTPKDITPGSGRVFWWRCFKVADHVWQAPASSILRSRKDGKTGCPFCAGHKVAADNNLASIYPNVASLWHKELNGNLKPSDVTSRSSRKAFWQCPKEKGHVWQAVVDNVVAVVLKGKSGCPYCTGKRASDENSLACLYPELKGRWDEDLNYPLTPDDVTAKSGRIVWWRCIDDPCHVFQLKIQPMVVNFERGSKGKCPQCTKEGSLAQAYPDLAILFHPDRNQPLSIDGVGPGSHKKVFWQCPYDQSHVWEQTVRKRVYSWKLGINCPTCKK